MSEFGGLQKHENIQHAPILGYEARHCCCWPAEGSPNFPLGKGTKYNRKTKEKNTHTKTPCVTVVGCGGVLQDAEGADGPRTSADGQPYLDGTGDQVLRQGTRPLCTLLVSLL